VAKFKVPEEMNMKERPSILVGIASHGTAQDHFLARVVAEYRQLNLPCRVVVLSNVNKKVDGAEVCVGVPTRDPYSLPFAHRRLFAENADNYDLFIYAEDDTLITQRNIDAFLDVQRDLEHSEVPGFMRSECGPDGTAYIVSINHHFRWLPDTVVRRGAGLAAQFSNQHSGCFIVTQQQLKRAISSGGFLVPARSTLYGMLETAASDIYTQCGLRRLISLSRIDDFIVPHLANKYYSRMGIPAAELAAQVRYLCEIDKNQESWRGSLLNPQTSAPSFRGSRNLYEGADQSLVDAIPRTTRRLLSVGAASGGTERALADGGIDVLAAPIDTILGSMLRSRGIQTIEGSMATISEKLLAEKFDAILVADVLQLVDDPVDWLNKLRGLLAADGAIVGSVPVVPNLLSCLRDLRDKRTLPFYPRHAQHGLRAASARKVAAWCRASRLTLTRVTSQFEPPPTSRPSVALSSLKSRIVTRLVFEARPQSS
jgi:2-polyprenyl-3-methyl-5-hydroxy-6-metoxy-1,4-benzoquinol methylase